MTELSFLLELLLHHKLPKATKDLVAERVKEVEVQLSYRAPAPPPAPRAFAVTPVRPELAGQAPSTQALLARHPDLIEQMTHGHAAPEDQAAVIPSPPAPPVTQIAHTPAAAQAMAERQSLILQAVSGKPEKGRTSPRKF